MSMRYKGSRLSATANTPTSLTASGAWTLQQQMQANGTSTWPFVRDPQFNYVTMLLHGDGSAGANNGSGGGVTPTVTNFNADASSNNFNVTINGDARSNNFTPYQAGYYSGNFDGSGDYLSVTSATQFDFGSGDFTLECWVFCNNFASDYRFIAKVANIGSFGSWQVLVDTSGYPRFYASSAASSWDVANNVGGGVVITANTWNHVAVTRSGTTFTIWVNGVSAGTTTSSASLYYSAAVPVTVGGMPDGTRSILGNISNARVVKGTAVYTSAFTPSTTPLTAITNTSLLTCQSNRFIDNSGNTFTITVNGNTAVSPAQPFTLPSSVATYGSGYFDGTTDYLTAPAANIVNFGTGDFEVDAWFNCSSTAAARKIVDNYNGTTNPNIALVVNFNGAGVVSWYSGQTALINSSSTFAPNTWNYVVVSRVSGTTRMFLNGTQVGSVSDSSNYAVGFTTVGIGGEPYSSGGTSFLGYLTDVRIVKGSGVTSSTVPTSPLTAITNTQLLTTQYNGGGNNNGFKDSSQNNFVITRNGNTTQGTFAPYGSNWSSFFNGSNAYLSSPADTALNMGTSNWTIECWVYISSRTLNYPLIFGNNNGGYTTGALAITNSNNDSASYYDKFFLAFYDVGTFVASGPTNSLNTWYHLAVVRNGTNISMYRNGSSVISTTISAGITFDWGKLGTRIGGGNWDGAQSYFNGNISNLRVIKGTALYTTAFTPSTTPLTAISGTSLLTCADNRFVDDSTNNFTVTANGSPSVQRFSPFANATAYNPATTGGSGYFDGSGDYLTAPDNAAFDFGSGNFTVECWIYPTVTGSNGGIVNKRASNASYPPFLLQFNTSTVLFGVSTSGSSWAVFTASAAVSLNAWHHIALVRNGTAITGYVDGAVSITGTATGALTTNSSAVAIGQDQANSGGNAFTGNIVDMRLTKGTALYTAAFTPPTAPLTPTANTSLLLSATNSAILDQSMMNDLETVGNAQISTSVVKYGTASMYFDGTGDGLFARSTPDSAFGTGDFTVEFWLNLAANLGSFVKIVMLGTTGNCFTIETQSTLNLLAVTNKNSTVYFYSSTALTTGTWIHVAVSRSSGTMRLFQNGTQVGSAANTVDFPNAGGLYIGRSDVGQEMNGYIDDLRITKYARYTTTFTPPTQALPNG